MNIEINPLADTYRHAMELTMSWPLFFMWLPPHFLNHRKDAYLTMNLLVFCFSLNLCVFMPPLLPTIQNCAFCSAYFLAECHQWKRAPTCSSFLKFVLVVQTLSQTYSSISELSQSSVFPLSFPKCFYFITQSVTISTAEARPLFFSPPSGHALKQKLLKFHSINLVILLLLTGSVSRKPHYLSSQIFIMWYSYQVCFSTQS